MRQSIDEIEFVVGNADILSEMQNVPAMSIYSEQVVAFLSELSGKLLSQPVVKSYPDVVTFGFWCRKANILSLCKLYENEFRLGRGVAFHIAPSNVPVNFAYSLVAGMLSGNANIARVPSKNFPQVDIICKAMETLLRGFPEIKSRLCLVRYAHSRDITNRLSSMCMSRVIWGGDETVAEIRKSPLPPRANEITFPDRYSVCFINTDRYISEHDRYKTAREFFNDTYLSDQNACTSPRLMIWFGEKKDEAKEIFWTELNKQLDGYDLKPVQSVNKLVSFYRYAASNDCRILTGDDNKIIRVEIDKITPQLVNHFDNSGYFYEYNAHSFDEVLPILGRKCQTLSYIGFEKEELWAFVFSRAPFGVDRIVPVGKTMDFSLVWDGVDLIRMLSRVISK